MTKDDRPSFRSEINYPTPARLRLRSGGENGVWVFDDLDIDAGPLTDELLLLNFEPELEPPEHANIQIFNETTQTIYLELRPQGGASVEPQGLQPFEAGKDGSWKCFPDLGGDCECADQKSRCKCSAWDIVGYYATAPGAEHTPVPDPTFKVRWKGHGDPPSSP